MPLLILVSSLASLNGSALCFIISLALLAFSVFVGPVTPEGRFYKRLNLFAAGVFFAVLAIALK